MCKSSLMASTLAQFFLVLYFYLNLILKFLTLIVYFWSVKSALLFFLRS